MQSPPYVPPPRAILDPAQQAPTKANLKAWWNQFNFVQKVKKEADSKEDSEHPVFGKPLKESLRYASVQISTANANGELFVWGYIPVVVAKWWVAFSNTNPPFDCCLSAVCISKKMV
jgi:hypothetical protein